jgi:hypothetical protein
MKFRMGRHTKKILQDYSGNNYGRMINEIAQISDINFYNDVKKIIDKYSPGLTDNYLLIVCFHEETRFEYLIKLKEKRQPKQN